MSPPGIFLHKKFSIMARQSVTFYTNHTFLIVIPVVDEGQKIKSNVDTYIRIIHLYILQLLIWIILFSLTVLTEDDKWEIQCENIERSK